MRTYANSHVIPIQTYVNDHMIAELAEPRIGTNVPRPFPRMCGGDWEQDCAAIGILFINVLLDNIKSTYDIIPLS